MVSRTESAVPHYISPLCSSNPTFSVNAKLEPHNTCPITALPETRKAPCHHWTVPSPHSNSASELQGSSLKPGLCFHFLCSHMPVHGVQSTEQVLSADSVSEQAEIVGTSPETGHGKRCLHHPSGKVHGYDPVDGRKKAKRLQTVVSMETQCLPVCSLTIS